MEGMGALVRPLRRVARVRLLTSRRRSCAGADGETARLTASAALRWPAAMRPATAAEYLDMSEGHFRTHVMPELVAVSLGGRAIGYLQADLDAWLDRRAGLSPHGLRKAAGVRLAEAGATAHQIMSILGVTLRTAVIYTQAAEQARMAVAGLARIG